MHLQPSPTTPALALLALFFAIPMLCSAEPPVFQDVASAVGLAFVHRPGTSEERYFPEIVGAGVALFDSDGDGDLDVYLVQGGSVAEADTGSGGRLFRNELVAGRPETLRFTDVTETSGLAAKGYGMGVGVLDYDGDGRRDLYLSNWGSNQLWRNDGGGRFSDRTREAGVDDARWSVPVVGFDLDRDRLPDLWIGNYADFRVANHKRCLSPTGREDYCAPVSYRAEPDRLFRNRGDGSFEDATLSSGLSGTYGYALGGVSGDFDGDGWPDLYVANDGVANQMWMNQGDGTFREDALLGGTAVNSMGEPEASMGVDLADIDDDGDLDLFLTHLRKETNTLYLNQGVMGFEDRTNEGNLGEASWSSTGFGVAWMDSDLDGDLDLLVVNGSVTIDQGLARAGDDYPFGQADQFFENHGSLRFVDVTEKVGPALLEPTVSRGAAVGDLDNDGDPDVVINDNSGPARLLLNQTPRRGAWIGFELVDLGGRIDPVGTAVTLGLETTAPRRTRYVTTSSSYASARDPRVIFGLGSTASERESVAVRWPDGDREVFRDFPVGEYSTLTRSSGNETETRAP